MYVSTDYYNQIAVDERPARLRAEAAAEGRARSLRAARGTQPADQSSGRTRGAGPARRWWRTIGTLLGAASNHRRADSLR